MRSNGKKFDLNIEKILEDWEVHHPIREIIANALDEQLLTGSKNIKISTFLETRRANGILEITEEDLNTGT